MVFLLVSAAFASTLAVTEAPLSCATSAFWERVDEAALDLDAPDEASAIAVTIGCTFVEPPGAVVDLAVGSSELTGLTVLGIRRGQGQLIVSATSEQAAILRRAGQVTPHVVKSGDWRPLLLEVERARRSR